VAITAALPLDVRKGFAFPKRLLHFLPRG
jgi:hypothetical protein